jgi:spermidine synthase
VTLWHEETHGIGITQALELRPVHAVTSPFQTIEVFDHDLFGRVLVLDGTVQLSQADEFIYHEMAVHVPLGARAWPAARVLIVGGGDGGILREVLRHPEVASVVMVEIDRAVVEVSNALVGIQGDYGDPRVTLLYADAVAYLSEAARAGLRFELILIDATDSTSPSKTLWTEAFYANVADCLSADGVCVDSDILVPGRPTVRLSRDPCDVSPFDLARRSTFSGVECYFTRVPLYPAGWFAFFLYTKDGVSCREPRGERAGRYYTPGVHRAAFALPGWWEGLMAGRGGSA